MVEWGGRAVGRCDRVVKKIIKLHIEFNRMSGICDSKYQNHGDMHIYIYIYTQGVL